MAPRRPKTTAQPIGRGRAQPKTVAAGLTTIDTGKPTVSFHYADRGYSGEWKWVEGEEADELVTFLCDISTSTWSEIRNQLTGGRNRHRKHHEQELGSLCSAAQQRIRDLCLDQVIEDAFRFRLGGEKRLWGFIRNDVFYVLWWDARHKVYPVEKD